MCTAVADEKYSCHILKPLESIDIPGLAGVLRHLPLRILRAQMGVGVQRDANIRVAHEVLRRLGVHGALCMLEQNVCLQT